MSSDLTQGLTQDGEKVSLRKSYSSHWHVPKDQHVGDISDESVKAGFRVKVYGILAYQLTITVLVSLACCFVDSLRDGCIDLAEGGNLGLLILVPTMCSLCVLFCVKDRFPLNFITLTIFTLCISINVGFICAVYYAAGAGALILLALVMTLIVFVTLTAFVMISGKSFGFMGGALGVCLTLMLLVGLVALFIPSLTDNLLWPVFGAIVFSCYVIFDTWKIEQVFGPDDYIIAAIELYLDIVNLFLYILQALSRD